MTETVTKKHETYVFGAKVIDGTRCNGCEWKTNSVLYGPEATIAHDQELGITHDCNNWKSYNVQDKVLCQCGKNTLDELTAFKTKITELFLRNNVYGSDLHTAVEEASLIAKKSFASVFHEGAEAAGEHIENGAFWTLPNPYQD